MTVHTDEERDFRSSDSPAVDCWMVVYAEREGEVIRIISAWKSGKKYREAYEENKQED